MTFTTTLDYSRRKFRALSRQLGFKAASVEEWGIWRDRLRATLLDITGIAGMSRCDLNPLVTENVQMDGYTRQRVVISTEPGVDMPLYVLIPDRLHPAAAHPAIIAPHGHGSSGKDAVVGNAATPDLADTIAEHNYDYGVQFVKRGCVVFCPDARGFGERREAQHQRDDQRMGSSCYNLNMVAISLGQSLTGMWTWDLMRLIDYVETRPEVDATRIGCAGLSGGGLQTLWLTALDERIKAAVCSGYFYGVEESLLVMSGNCSCNFVPHLWEKADMGDLGALIAPRPFCVETGDIDGLNGTSGLANVQSQLDISQKAYDLLDEPDNLKHVVFAGPHKWCGDETIPWLLEQL